MLVDRQCIPFPWRHLFHPRSPSLDRLVGQHVALIGIHDEASDYRGRLRVQRPQELQVFGRQVHVQLLQQRQIPQHLLVGVRDDT